LLTPYLVCRTLSEHHGVSTTDQESRCGQYCGWKNRSVRRTFSSRTPVDNRTDRSCARYFEDNPKTVKVYVGPKRKLWTIPEDYLCDRLDYFKAALKSNFKEGHEKEMYLEEDDPVAFGMLIDWLFRDKLDCDCRRTLTTSDWCPTQLDWCKLYVLADKFGIEVLLQQVLQPLSLCFTPQTLEESGPSIDYDYDNTAESSKLRIWFVGRATDKYLICQEDYLEKWIDLVRTHRAFDLDVAKAIKSHMRVDWKNCLWRFNGCAAHQPSDYNSDSNTNWESD
jgi:hypothetical protein